jgi:homoserine acetyltransferase
MEKKFTPVKAEQVTQKKDFTIPKPGITTKPTVVIGKVGTQVLKKIFINTGVEEEDQEIGRSQIFNQPIYADITFNAGSYVDEGGLTINYQSLYIEDALITVRNAKNIIRTTLQGRDGTVKEYISDGDYMITIEGRIYGKGMNNYPQEEVQNLIRICKAPQAINITSTFLKMFDVEDLVIEDRTIQQLEGIRNYQSFTLQCSSDKPLILLKNA